MFLLCSSGKATGCLVERRVWHFNFFTWKHTFFDFLKHAFSVIIFNVFNVFYIFANFCEFTAIDTLVLLLTVFTVYSYRAISSYNHMCRVYNIFRIGFVTISTLYLANSEIHGFNLLFNEFEFNYSLRTTCVLTARRSSRYYNIFWWFLCGCSASTLPCCLTAGGRWRSLSTTINSFVPVGSGVVEDATTACYACVWMCASGRAVPNWN